MSFEQTENFKTYQKYLQVKQAIFFEYKGVDLSKVASWKLLAIILDGYKAKFRDFIYLPFLFAEATKFADAFKTNDVVLSTLYNTRKEHADLAKKIASSIDSACILDISSHKKKIKINLKLAVRLWRLFFFNPLLKDIGLKNRVYLYMSFLYAANQADEFKKTFSNIQLYGKGYIPFNSSVDIEAFLTQFFNNKGVETFHIFHGIFGRYKLRIANDIINGENITAKNILSFGEVTKLDMEKDFLYPSSRVFIAGNPKYENRIININLKFRKCLVLNGFGFYDKSFAPLLPILDEVCLETGIVFHIKPHPNSGVVSSPEAKNVKNVKFLPREVAVKDLLESGEYDFSITFNTVTYYESMYYNMLSLRYADGENLAFEGLDDKFQDKDSLITQIKKFSSADRDAINKEVKELLVKALGMGINNYNRLTNQKAKAKGYFKEAV